MYNVNSKKNNKRPNINSTNSLPLDQYIPVNYSKGMLAVPTFVDIFEQTHVKVSSILRNKGTLQKAGQSFSYIPGSVR